MTIKHDSEIDYEIEEYNNTVYYNSESLREVEIKRLKESEMKNKKQIFDNVISLFDFHY
jgi:hypothetical protein